MATIVPVDEFVTDEWYPGFKPAFEHAPYYVEPFRTFNKEDEKRFWFLDFHWPRGLTPLGLIWNEDGYNWGTQFAAENLPLPPGRGLVSRIAGIHTYASPIDVQSPYEIGERAQRMGPRLGEFLANFDEIWASRRDEVERGWQHFVAMDPSTRSQWRARCSRTRRGPSTWRAAGSLQAAQCAACATCSSPSRANLSRRVGRSACCSSEAPSIRRTRGTCRWHRPRPTSSAATASW